MKRLLPILLIFGCGSPTQDRSYLKEPMNALNNPAMIPGSSMTLDYKLSRLPEAGTIDRLWGGWWWPMSERGTASQRFGSKSPMEKYDIVAKTNGKVNKWEIDSTAAYANVGWAGHCNGLSASSIMMEEPVKAVVLDGVSFSVEDVKALLVEKWQGSGSIVGDRCDKKNITYDSYGRIREAECRDLNPATFHLALTNFLGLSGKSLIADIDNTEAVWNYPIQTYQVVATQSLTQDQATWRIQKDAITTYSYNTSAVDFMYVKTSVTFLGFDPRSYEYILELDVKGNIIGGEWLDKSKREHPDFIWRPSDPRAENPYLDPEIIDKIYKMSI
jgi:hypothetical protein